MARGRPAVPQNPILAMEKMHKVRERLSTIAEKLPKLQREQEHLEAVLLQLESSVGEIDPATRHAAAQELVAAQLKKLQEMAATYGVTIEIPQ